MNIIMHLIVLTPSMIQIKPKIVQKERDKIVGAFLHLSDIDDCIYKPFINSANSAQKIITMKTQHYDIYTCCGIHHHT